MTARLLRGMPALVLTAGIYAASAQPGIAVGGFALSDKLVHAVAWALLTASYVFALTDARRPTPTALALALVAAMAYGAFDELHQSWVPGRDASVADWLADCIGSVASVAWVRRRAQRRAGTGATGARLHYHRDHRRP